MAHRYYFYSTNKHWRGLMIENNHKLHKDSKSIDIVESNRKRDNRRGIIVMCICLASIIGTMIVITLYL